MTSLIFSDVASRLVSLRGRLAGCFKPDTAAPGTSSSVPSAGHCAAVAVLVHAEFGGDFVSAIVNGQSHWFNRLRVDNQVFDVDITGDQFGRPEVQYDDSGALYPQTRLRFSHQLNLETLRRALLLAHRSEERSIESHMPACARFSATFSGFL